jgi:hypothetical protein
VPDAKPTGKVGGMKKLPTWAWIAAGGVGIILGVLLFRSGSLTPSQPDQASQPDQPPDQQDAGVLAPEWVPFDWLNAIGMFFSPGAGGGGGGGGQGGGESSGGAEVSVTPRSDNANQLAQPTLSSDSPVNTVAQPNLLSGQVAVIPVTSPAPAGSGGGRAVM